MTECLAFRGIRYAQAERFSAASLLPWNGEAQQVERGPIPPQNPSRFAAVLGPQAPLTQSEDCLVLSVFTPSRTGRRPVMVWFHGGANLTGGGELPWYDGHQLALEQDVVVVTVTARLGVLGFLLLEEHSAGPSPTTSDHQAALQWVVQNVGEFGGDANNITLFGNSAGGFAVDSLLRWGVGSQVRGAILQSGFLSQSDIIYKRADAFKVSRRFIEMFDGDVRAASTADLLKAQTDFAIAEGRSELWAPIHPAEPKALKVPIIAGATHDDALPFVLLRRGISEPSRDIVNEVTSEADFVQYEQIEKGNLALVRKALRDGQHAWLYNFAWSIPSSGWGSPHCMELPYLLGDRKAWDQAPMVRGADWHEVHRRGQYLRSAWASFARTGSPGRDWVPFRGEREDITTLDDSTPTLGDSTGGGQEDASAT